MPKSKSKRRSVLRKEKAARRKEASSNAAFNRRKRQSKSGYSDPRADDAKLMTVPAEVDEFEEMWDFDELEAFEEPAEFVHVEVRAPGRLTYDEISAEELRHIVADPTRRVPEADWHPDDAAWIRDWLSLYPSAVLVRLDDGRFALAACVRKHEFTDETYSMDEVVARIKAQDGSYYAITPGQSNDPTDLDIWLLQYHEEDDEEEDLDDLNLTFPFCGVWQLAGGGTDWFFLDEVRSEIEGLEFRRVPEGSEDEIVGYELPGALSALAGVDDCDEHMDVFYYSPPSAHAGRSGPMDLFLYARM